MYCSNCGAECSDGARFCIKCGQKLIHNKEENARYDSDDVPILSEITKDTTYKSDNESLTGRGTIQKARFPIAVIFILLHGIISLNNAACRLMESGVYVYVGVVGHFFWPTLLQFLFIIAIVVLLFRRKTNTPLVSLLVLYSMWNILACTYNVPLYSTLVWRGMIQYDKWSPVGFLSHSVSPYFILFDVEILSYIVIMFLAISLVRNRSRFSAVMKKAWYISGILSCLEAVIWVLFSQFYTIRAFVLILCLIPENFFLGWWLAHPYKAQSVPAYHPNPASETAPSYDSESVVSGLTPNDNLVDAPSFGYAALGFFIPVAGLVLYLVWKEQIPFRAKSAGKGALIGVIVWISLSIIIAILSVILPMMMLRGYY